MSIAIKIENLSKQYRLGLVSTRTLSHDLNRWWQTSVLGKEDPYLKIGETNIRESKGTSEYVWALKDINLDVEEGEVLGIIGKNGAGKSTLLKILSKVTTPTTGIVKARGRIASLLEVGTGFHQEMTGRENIFMNGAIMGMTKAEIRQKFDEIVEFAGIERYIDTPVKRYSSGMIVRLGFSIAAHLEPEILVVDEVLAVGDAEFQKKAIGKMQDVSSNNGRTVLFVSHNILSIRILCHRGIVLSNGSLEFQGKVNNTIDYYLSTIFEDQGLELSKRTERTGNQWAKFIGIEIESNKIRSSKFLSGKDVSFKITIESYRRIENANLNISIYNAYGALMTTTNNYIVENKLFSLHHGINIFVCSYDTIPLIEGNYYMNVSLLSGSINIDWLINAISFEVLPNDLYGTGKHINQGIIALKNSIKKIE